MLKVITTLLLVVMLSACPKVVSYRTATTSFENSTSCCESIKKFDYQVLYFGSNEPIKLDGSTPAFQFPTGKSYFAAFRLPLFTDTYNITVQSYALGDTPDRAHIFYPQIDLLDENFSVIAHSNPQDFSLNKSPLPLEVRKEWGVPLNLKGTIKVDSSDFKYMVIYTTSELLNTSTPYVSMRYVPFIIPGVVGSIPIGNAQIYIPHSPFAHLYIVLHKGDEPPKRQRNDPADIFNE